MKNISYLSDGSATTGLELEIVQEQAESLGLAGKKLQEAIDHFNSLGDSSTRLAGGEAALQDVVSRAWALLVQRELIGFKHENLRWLVDRFDLPEPALRLLGRQQ